MHEDEWTFSATIRHPDGTTVDVMMSVPKHTADDWRHRAKHAETPLRTFPEPVLECSELAQMGASRAMSAYAATKEQNESLAVPF